MSEDAILFVPAGLTVDAVTTAWPDALEAGNAAPGAHGHHARCKLLAESISDLLIDAALTGGMRGDLDLIGLAEESVDQWMLRFQSATRIDHEQAAEWRDMLGTRFTGLLGCVIRAEIATGNPDWPDDYVAEITLSCHEARWRLERNGQQALAL